jgi:hypothetical protein
MKELRFMLSFLALVLAASLAPSCGTGQSQLQFISLNPAAADAQDYPDGQVPFIATGHYVNPTHTVTPQSATWVACQQEGPITTEVSVTQEGVAQCASGATGTYSINAWDTDKIEPCAINACGILVCAIVGTAQLTCP